MNDIPREFSLLPRDPRTPLSDEELRQWTNARTERFVRSDRYPAALDRWLAEMAIVLGDDEAKAKLISRKEVGAILGNTRETIRVAINEGHYFRAIVLVSNVNLIAQYLGTLQQSITNDNVLLTNEGANYFGD